MSAGAQAASNANLANALPAIAPSGTRDCPVGRVRYAIFFDGTNNNAYRDWFKGFAQAKPEPGKKAPGEADLRGTESNKVSAADLNAPTNVAKLYYLFIENGELEKRLYVTGVGSGDQNTAPGGGNDFEQATGKGASNKIHDALKSLTEFVNVQNKWLAVEKRVDAFGFSRGATEARDFFNTTSAAGVEDRSRGKCDYRYIAMGMGPPARVPTYPRMDGILFEFCGVFDTVASMGAGAVWSFGNTVLAGYNLAVNGRPADKKKKPAEILNTPCEKQYVKPKEGWVHRTFHCVADDEHRDLFPLEVLGKDPKGWFYRLLPRNMREQSYPGAHSDVGGGYRYSPFIPKGPDKVEHHNPWFGKAYDTKTPGDPAVPEKFGNLSHIPLRDMREEAVKGHVPLKPVNDLPTGLWEINNPAAPKGVKSLSDLYESYLKLRTRLISKYIGDTPKWADYTRDLKHDPAYLQALPEDVYQKICKDRDADPDYKQLSDHFIHTPWSEEKWRKYDGYRRRARNFVLPWFLEDARDQDVKGVRGARQRDVHYMGGQHTYDDDCYL